MTRADRLWLTFCLSMLLTEPAVTCMAIYASFVFALIYMFLEVIPIVYLEGRHWSPVVSTLPYLSIFVGVLLAVFVNLANQPLYAKAMTKNNNKPVPEARLPPIIIGIVLLVIGMFWFAWTAEPRIHWILPTIALGMSETLPHVKPFCLTLSQHSSVRVLISSSSSASTFLLTRTACMRPAPWPPTHFFARFSPAGCHWRQDPCFPPWALGRR